MAEMVPRCWACTCTVEDNEKQTYIVTRKTVKIGLFMFIMSIWVKCVIYNISRFVYRSYKFR